jgi:hypothetical protein
MHSSSQQCWSVLLSLTTLFDMQLPLEMPLCATLKNPCARVPPPQQQHQQQPYLR